MYIHEYNDLRIEVSDDPTYKVGSSDDTIKYSKHYLVLLALINGLSYFRFKKKCCSVSKLIEFGPEC